MSLEVKKEKQEIEVTIKYLKCDLCNMRITAEQPMITVKVSSPYSNLDIVMRPKRDYGEIDVCSAECLTKNIGGAKLILDTRLVPDAHQQIKNPTGPEKSNDYKLSVGGTESVTHTASTDYTPTNTVTFDKIPNAIQ